MVVLRLLIFIATYLLLAQANAREIELICSGGLRCEDYSSLRQRLEHSQAKNSESVQFIFNQLYSQGKYINLSAKDSDEGRLTVVLEGYKRIKNYRLNSPIKVNFDEVIKALNFKNDIPFSEEIVKTYTENLRQYFVSHKIADMELRAQPIFEGDDIVLEFSLISSTKIKLKKVHIQSVSWVVDTFAPYFFDFYNRDFDPLAIKLKSDQIAKELYNMGFFKSKVSVLTDKISDNKTELESYISIELSDKYNIVVRGVGNFIMQDIRNKIYDRVRIDLGEFNEQSIKEMIVDHYEKSGFYNTTVKFRKSRGIDLNKNTVINVYVDVAEGKKIPVSQILYKGMNILNRDDIDSLYKKSTTPLAASRFYDREFFESFSDLIKKKYFSLGYVQAEVSKPIVNFLKDKTISIEYYINERDSYKVSAVNISSIDKSIEKELKERLVNKENHPINVTSIESDIQVIVTYLQENGYYFANVKNAKDSSLLAYDKANLQVSFNPDVELGNKICYNDLIVAGNRKTRMRVFEREFNLQKGDVIKPSHLEEFNQRLSNLGLFATLRTTPYVLYEMNEGVCSKTNILVQVKEKDFGLAEIAPGYRTDLGWKLSAGATYNNIGGMNRQATVQAQSNLRTSLSGFDTRRKTEDKELVEYTFKFSFIEPYVFHNMLKTQLEFETQASAQKKRFYGFDANIYRVSPQFSKTFNNYLVTSVRYQFEKIEQFNATESKDNDDFVIGSITPSITLDLRNDAVYTRKGAYFNLSSEWANKYFGSMENQDIQINYIKVISRNRFYIPFGDVTLAMSVSGGYQKNFATEVYTNSSGQSEVNSNGKLRTRGYIPSIKLFRLEGYDEVRGFEDSEINVVESGDNIGEVILQDSLYFVNFKLEPRYNLTDQLQIGIFYDAGRLFTESVKPFKLRSAVGAGVKFLTPVGSLDFDYGVKLDRKTNKDGAQESFGRFHLSIGFF